MTAPGARLGTAFYTAPELWQDGNATKASDIYAFGCLAYEALTGRPPFMGVTEQVIHGHLTRSAAPPSSYRPECRGSIDAAIAALLNKDPDLRPLTASAALAMIRPDASAATRVQAGAASGAARGTVQPVWPTLAHTVVYAGLFAGAFAVGRGTGVPAVWGLLTLIAIGMALLVYIREGKARSWLVGTTVGLDGGPALQGAPGPPSTETIVPQALPPGKRPLPRAPENPYRQ
jgi:serine/threonine-protein kinase